MTSTGPAAAIGTGRVLTALLVLIVVPRLPGAGRWDGAAIPRTGTAAFALGCGAGRCGGGGEPG